MPSFIPILKTFFLICEIIYAFALAIVIFTSPDSKIAKFMFKRKIISPVILCASILGFGYFVYQLAA